MLSTFADGNLFGLRLGTGLPKVLALHGWGGSARQLAPAVERFGAISLDLPGFGRSPAPALPWGAAEYAGLVASVLQEFDRPPTVLGYSFGGRIAVHLAAEHPELVGNLVLTGVPLLRRVGTAKTSKIFRLAKRLHRLGLVSDTRMEAERQKRGSTDYRRASGVMRDVLVRSVNETYEDELARIATPTEFVWGSADTAAPTWIVEEAQALMPTSTPIRVTVCEGRDHYFPVNEPLLLADALERSLV
jgi:pimeloyl-ACP methyl ester carboxylesterase